MSKYFVIFFAAAIFSLNVNAVTRFSHISKCSKVEFRKPDSPDLDKCPLCEVDDRGILTCECFIDKEGGPVRKTSLPIYSCPRNYAYPRCADHIEVKQGELTCRKISEESTYQNSCWSCSAEGSLLTCDCYKQDRTHEKTSLEMKNCFEPISSCFGALTCGLCPPEKFEQGRSWIKPAALFFASTVSFAVVGRLLWLKFIRR